MRILVFQSITQLNFHICYAICVGLSQIMMGMVFVMVLIFYTNGKKNEHTPWNYPYQNTHSGKAIVGYQLLLAQGILAHNRTDNWSSSLSVYARVFVHVIFMVVGSIFYWFALEDIEVLNNGRLEACGVSDHCEYGWMAMYIAITAMVLGPFALAFKKIVSIFHSFLGALAFIWASVTVITGIRADIAHREIYQVITHQHEKIGRMAIFFIYFYTIVILAYPFFKACKFAYSVVGGFIWFSKMLKRKKESSDSLYENN